MSDTLSAINLVADFTPTEIILATKLNIPQPRANLVSRPHLVARLNAALNDPPGVILISAPPGFGKTTLLGEWVLQLAGGRPFGYRQGGRRAGEQNIAPASPPPHTPAQTAWLSLDDDDNTPHCFLSYCIAALQTVYPDIGQDTLEMLRHPSAKFISAETLVSSLINEMMAIAEPFVFVFEDYHAINNPLLHNSLAFLLNNLPPQLCMVITTRTTPPLPLARLRAQGQLTELGAADLRFTADEVSTFLNSVMGCQLSPDEVAALEARTEGWIAGLQMAALSMRGVRDTATFVESFTGTHRHIFDYLVEEVLHQQPDERQHFLLRTAILNRLTGPLCDAILSRGAGGQGGRDENYLSPPPPHPRAPLPIGSLASSQEMLESLEQANLFLIPLDNDRRWYRYHHLFAEALRHRLEQQEGAEIVAILHRRASEWLEQRGYPTEAMTHALAAVDVERIVRLAKQRAVTMLSRSELVTLVSWLDALPEASAQGQPRLALVQAWAMLLTGQLQAVEPYLAQAEQEFQRTYTGESVDVLSEIATLRAAVAYFQRDMGRAIELYRQALQHISPDNLFLRGIVLQCLGAAHSWHGDVVEATAAFSEAGSISQQIDNLTVALIAIWNVAQLQVEQGQLHQAAQIYRDALHLIEQQPEGEQKALLPYAGRLRIGLAEVLYQWDDLAVAEQQLQQGITLAEQGQESGTLAGGYLALSQIKQAQGDIPAALEAIQTAQQFAGRYAGPRYLSLQCATRQARLWLAQGNLRAVSRWIQEQDLQLDPLPAQIPYLQESQYFTLARLLLAQEQSDESFWPIESPLELALDILDRLAVDSAAAKRTDCLIESLALRALVYQVQQATGRALDSLQEALQLAEPEGYARVFVDEGPLMGDLIKQIKPPDIGADYRARLLAAFKQAAKLPSPQDSLPLDPLSERELEILQLIAAGMSNRELAETLVVTVGTVKWHLNNIYSKLGVKSRTQAVAQARVLGLL